MRAYVVRLLEMAAVAFLGAGVPVLVAEGINKAALSGALAAGVAAAYGVVAKKLGDKDRPTLSK